jgi:hypothetical protein
MKAILKRPNKVSYVTFTALAPTMGLNPNVWFNNVEIAAAQVIGRETVQYVGNIYK